MPDVEIDRRVKVGVVELLDHVRADNADLRGTMRHESRDVERTHADQAHVAVLAVERQCARLLVVELRLGHDPCTRHEWQRFVEDTALGHGECQRFRHGARI